MAVEFTNDEARETWLQNTAAGFCSRMVNAWTAQGLPMSALARIMAGMASACVTSEEGRDAALAFLDELREQIEAQTFSAGASNRRN